MTKRELIQYLEYLKIPDDTPIMSNDYEYGICEVHEQSIKIETKDVRVTVHVGMGPIETEIRQGPFIVIG